MMNPYEKGSRPFELFDEAELLAQNTGYGPEHATDRLAIALYRAGAALTDALDSVAHEIGQMNNG